MYAGTETLVDILWTRGIRMSVRMFFAIALTEDVVSESWRQTV